MITNLLAISPAALEAALTRNEAHPRDVRVYERSEYAVAAYVECGGTCGMVPVVNGHVGSHCVDLMGGSIECDCPARVLCGHAAALLAHERGKLPTNPEQDRSYLPTPECYERCAYGDGLHSSWCPHYVDDTIAGPTLAPLLPVEPPASPGEGVTPQARDSEGAAAQASVAAAPVCPTCGQSIPTEDGR